MPITDRGQAESLINELQYEALNQYEVLNMWFDDVRKKMEKSGPDIFQAVALTNRTRAFAGVLDLLTPDETWKFYQAACKKYPQLHETAIDAKSLKFYDVLLEKFQELDNGEQISKNEKRRAAILKPLLTAIRKNPHGVQNELQYEVDRDPAELSDVLMNKINDEESLIRHAMQQGCENMRKIVFESLPKEKAKGLRINMLSKSFTEPSYRNISDEILENLCQEVSKAELYEIFKEHNFAYPTRPKIAGMFYAQSTPEQL